MTTTQFTVPTGDNFPAALQFTDAFGNIGAAPSGEVPVWAVDNDAILTVDTSADPTGMSAKITTVGPIGVANVIVTDTSLDGTSFITGTLQVTVSAGPVSTLTIVPGTPVVNA